MTAATPDDERRRFSRIAFHRPADLDVRIAQGTCEVLDVSLKGALVEVPYGFPAHVGQRCTLVIRLDAGDVAIRMEGEIVHREGTQAGIRCVEIDLESISHLRRIVELNVGDEDVLHRELSALVARR
ncbi:MAG TPA: PilZ domain-containing protein [Anaeromyxobacter sp.]|nr:PilZ domain-containing protein [Anaeromyxobacter sp.]